MPELRIGIIGFGGAGAAHHSYFTSLDDCRVVKVFDPKPEGLERAGRIDPAIERCSEIKAFWRDLDLVSVCSPDRTHADYICEAVQRGLHVICEKPLTDSIEGIRKIKGAERASGCVIGVLHQMRFVPLFRKIKTILNGNELGTISALEAYYVHDLTERSWVNDDWRRTDNATPLVYAGCHFVDLMRWYAGEEITEVYAVANHKAFPQYPESDFNAVTLQFRSGVIGKLLVSFGSACPQDHSVRVYGNHGCIDNSALFLRGSQGIKWARTIHQPILLPRQWRAESASLPRRVARECLSIRSRLLARLPAYLLARAFESARRFLPPEAVYGIRHYPFRLYEHELACVEAIENVLMAVRKSAPLLCTVDESARTVLACLASVESFRTRRPVPVPALESIV
jgi:predicted dehydrogenase